MHPRITIKKLQTYRNKQFSLQIPKMTITDASVVAVVGQNGSGKTTLVETLAGILPFTHGEIHIDGHTVYNNLKDAKTLVGFIPDDEDWFVKELSAKEYFQLLIHVYKQAGVSIDMQERLDLMAKALEFSQFEMALQDLSHGNKKKVQIIAALLHSPKLLIIDELRNGLDPLAIITAEQLVEDFAAQGGTVVAATHDIWWAERIADHLLFLKDGKVTSYLPTGEVIAAYGTVQKAFIGLCTEKGGQ